jgi:hypothetical protein
MIRPGVTPSDIAANSEDSFSRPSIARDFQLTGIDHFSQLGDDKVDRAGLIGHFSPLLIKIGYDSGMPFASGPGFDGRLPEMQAFCNTFGHAGWL